MSLLRLNQARVVVEELGELLIGTQTPIAGLMRFDTSKRGVPDHDVFIARELSALLDAYSAR